MMIDFDYYYYRNLFVVLPLLRAASGEILTEIEYFLNCISTNKQPKITKKEVLAALDIALKSIEMSSDV